ncbi:DUF4878 domain-containing protein [Clostridium botulinum]|nr:DUF4878 domain-containing protein [Clostridium botulinum]
MKSILKKLMPIIFIAILSVSLTGCSPKPDETVKGFFEALKQQDIQKASKYVKQDSSDKKLQINKFDSKEQEKMVKDVLAKVEYSLGDVEKSGDTATAKVSVTSIDLGRITTKTINEMLPTLMSQAFSQEKVDKKKQQAVILQHILNSINDPNAPKTKTDITVKLVKDDNGWLIEPDEQLINALTGNFYSISKKLQSK